MDAHVRGNLTTAVHKSQLSGLGQLSCRGNESSCKCYGAAHASAIKLLLRVQSYWPGGALSIFSPRLMTQQLDMQAGAFQEGCRVAATPAQPPPSAQQPAGHMLPVPQPHLQTGQGQVAFPSQVSSLSHCAQSLSARS